MKAPSTAQLYAFAWRNVRHLPDPFVLTVAALAADVTWLLHRGQVRQLERNIARLRPDLAEREVRRLSRRGMRSYLRYFAEAFQLPGWSSERVLARTRPAQEQRIKDLLAGGDSVVLALGHSGNWDLAGAYAGRDLGAVLTVAEKLPDGLYEEFVSFRAGLGIKIIPLEGGVTFRTLMRRAKEEPQLIPLLADRDLSKHGVEVTIAGRPARVAAGPAALALTVGLPLIPLPIYYERLTGERRRAAGARWGIVCDFLDPIPVTIDGVKRSVADITQDWVDAYFAVMSRHPEDWHMLQKVFLEDLDPDRLARANTPSSTEANTEASTD